MHRFGGVGFLILILGCALKTAFACNGYSLKLNYIRNCVDNSIYQFRDFGLTLDKDCNVKATGCVEITKAFKTAEGKYTVKKPPMPTIEGEVDFCEAVDTLGSDPMAKQLLEMFSLPKKCPVTAPKKACAKSDKSISISKYKNQIGLAAGTSEVKVEVEHDTGKTCVELSVTIKRGKRS